MPLVCAIKTTFFAEVRPLCEITSVLQLCKFLVIQTFKNLLLVSKFGQLGHSEQEPNGWRKNRTENM
jgi:hypothetical protein